MTGFLFGGLNSFNPYFRGGEYRVETLSMLPNFWLAQGRSCQVAEKSINMVAWAAILYQDIDIQDLDPLPGRGM